MNTNTPKTRISCDGFYHLSLIAALCLAILALVLALGSPATYSGKRPGPAVKPAPIPAAILATGSVVLLGFAAWRVWLVRRANRHVAWWRPESRKFSGAEEMTFGRSSA
jgi:hypothetical protein